MYRPSTWQRFTRTSEAAWITAFAWITCFVGTSPVDADNEVGPAPVVEATVYLDGAEVVREVMVEHEDHRF